MPAPFGSFAAPQRSAVRGIIRHRIGIPRSPDDPTSHRLELPGRLAVWVAIQVLVATTVIVRRGLGGPRWRGRRAGLAHFLIAQEPLLFFLVAMATAATFALVNVALVIPTLALKGKVSLAEASRSYDASFLLGRAVRGALEVGDPAMPDAQAPVWFGSPLPEGCRTLRP